MKNKGLLLSLFVVLAIIISLSFVSAVGCISDIQCPGQGQEECYKEDDHYIIRASSCVNGACGSEIIRVVDCCDIIDCASNQVCKSGKCVSNQPSQPISPSDKNVVSNNENFGKEFLIAILMISIALIIGLIILALILKSGKKK